MTNQEFSSEFEILYNNIMSNQAPGLDDYEKSVFLTQAQELFILEVYSGVFNTEAFESTELINEFLNTLVKKYTTSTPVIADVHTIENSVLYTLPENLWLIVYEHVVLQDSALECMNGTTAIVVPTTHDELYRTYNNPFRGADKNRVLRLRNNNYSELISKYSIGTYLIKYIEKPSPIVLVDLTDIHTDISIDGVTDPTECALHPIVHKIILNKAVELAKISMSSK